MASWLASVRRPIDMNTRANFNRLSRLLGAKWRTLFKPDGAQLLKCDRVLMIYSKHTHIFDLGFIVIPCLEVAIGPLQSARFLCCRRAAGQDHGSQAQGEKPSRRGW